MEKNFEYYMMNSAPLAGVPLLAFLGSDPLDYCEVLDDSKKLNLCFADPIPNTPRLVDHMTCPHSIISQKLYDVLNPMNLSTVQLLPSVVIDMDGKEFEPFWAVNIHEEIKCVDEELSDCEITDTDLSNVKKVILDKKVLGEIPLADRLVFRLEEQFTLMLYHVSIKEAIEEVNPLGVKFINIEDWTWATHF